MASRPPERYEPGELDRTRNNLGELSREEARKMQERLGGEVGAEKTSRAVESKYEKLKYQNRPEADKTVRNVPPAYEGEPEGVSYFLTGEDGKIKRVVRRFGQTKMKGRERIKTDFYCARPEIGLKTTRQAFASLFTLVMHVPDTVCYRFIMEADNVFGRSVENLVLGVRGLMTKSYKTASQTIRRTPLYNEILKVLRSWDIEAIGEELSRLQAKPHHRTVEEFIPLMKVLLKPMFLLHRLSLSVHLLPALSRMYELGRQFASNQGERDRLVRYYTIAREELPWVFSVLKTRFFPLLLKNISDRFMLPEDFYLKMEAEILEFLEIKESDLLTAEGPVKIPEPSSADLGGAVQGDLPVVQDNFELPPQITPLPRIAERGLDLLDRMFPRAGWKNLDAHPDLYAYFQPILDYPKGGELLPPLDPLQPAVTLCLVVQNLLAGFQSLKFGVVKNAQGQAESLTGPVEKAITQFHFFMEEVIAKHYLGTLSDLTRAMERSGKMGAESKKLTAVLLWLRKQYLLPHISMPVLEDVRPQALSYPPLNQLVRRLIELLSPVAVDVESTLARQKANPSRGFGFTALENPLEPFRFQVETPVSQRLHQVFRKVVSPGEDQGIVKDGRTNRTLLFSVLSLLNLLDQWLSQPGSVLYLAQPPVLFRTATGDPGDETPVYGVEKRDTPTLLKKQTEKENQQQAQGHGLAAEENLPELYGSFIAKEELRVRILAYHQDKIPFSILALRIHGLEEGSPSLVRSLEAQAQEMVQALKKPDQVFDPGDQGTMVLILPGADRSQTMKTGRDLLTAGAYRKIPLAIMGVAYQAGWSQEKLLAVPVRGFSQAETYPPQVLGWFQGDLGAFDFVEDLPVVAAQSGITEADPRDAEVASTEGIDEETAF